MNPRMNWRKKLYYPKVASILGAFLVLLPGRPVLYWGNMAIYVMSYIIVRQQGHEGVEPVWLVTMYDICWSTGMLVNGFLADIIGKRVVIAFGIVAFNLCIFLSYYALKVSVTTFIMIFGSFTGFGNGLMEGLLFKNFVVPWSTNDTGRLTSIVMSAAQLGAVVWDQFITLYLNPDNASTNTTKGKLKLFNQASILNKVPPMLIIIGTTSTVLQIIGFCLLNEKKDSKIEVDSTEVNNYDSMKGVTLCDQGGEDSSNISAVIPNEDESSSNSALHTTNESGNLHDQTTTEMIKSPLFYLVWVGYFSSTTSRTILNTYYKIYGQTHIHDDHFLTNLGATMLLLAAVITLLWGIIMDRVPLKMCHVVILTILALTNIFIFFSAAWGRWVYFFVCTAMTCATAPLYMCYTVTLILLFGRGQLNVKMTVFSTAPLTSSLVAAPVAEILLSNLGWFSLFMWPAILAILSLICVTHAFPETQIKGGASQ